MNNILTKANQILDIKNDLNAVLTARELSPGNFSEYAQLLDYLTNVGQHEGTVNFEETASGPYGSGSNRTSGGSYLWYYSQVFVKAPFILTKVYWDVNSGRTFTLFIDDVDMGSATSSSVGDIEFPIDPMIVNGYHKFQITASSSISLRDGPLAANDVFSLPYVTKFSNGITYNYYIPIKLEGRRMLDNNIY